MTDMHAEVERLKTERYKSESEMLAELERLREENARLRARRPFVPCTCRDVCGDTPEETGGTCKGLCLQTGREGNA